MATVAPAHAATVTDCTSDGAVPIAGGAYVYQQNVRSAEGQQCVQVDDETGAFTVTSASFNLPTNGPAATYPSVFKGCRWGACTSDSGMPVRVDRIGSATTSWDTTGVDAGAYDVAYDLWFNSTPTTTGQPDGSEVSIWLSNRGGVQPFGAKVATATVAGKQWDVWVGQQTGWKVVTYVLTTGTGSVKDLDAKAIVDDAVARGSVDPAHYLLDVEAGFDIWVGGQGLASKGFSFEVSPADPVGATTATTTAPAGARNCALPAGTTPPGFQGTGSAGAPRTSSCGAS